MPVQVLQEDLKKWQKVPGMVMLVGIVVMHSVMVRSIFHSVQANVSSPHNHPPSTHHWPPSSIEKMDAACFDILF